MNCFKIFRRFGWLTGFLLSLFAAPALAAPRYIDFKPLEETVRESVANVATGDTVLVPVITWGGDLATIYANGNSRTTQAGSIFAKQGLKLNLKRQDVFTEQLKDYLRGKSPYLRGTLGMINSASDLLNKDERTKPVVIYQMTWSAGGDALVVKDNIASAKDLKGKTIALQANGPHVDYAIRIIQDAGLNFGEVNIKWLPDLTGTGNSPMAALYEKDVDAAFVIIPDALALTSGGNVGTGAEDSVKGARILLSTKTANRVIADVYAVRSDYLKTNNKQVQAFVKGLLEAEEELAKLVAARQAQAKPYGDAIRAGADILLDSVEAVADTEGLYADAEFAHFNGNQRFFADASYPRRFEVLNREIQSGLKAIGLVKNPQVTAAAWDFNQLRTGLTQTATEEKNRFNTSQVAQVVSEKQKQNRLSDSELFSFEVFFEPNQNSFSADLYKEDFQRVIHLASTYGGAIITVEGHSDPMGYLRGKKSGESAVVLGQIKQAAKNLSLTRAQSVRDSVVDFAKTQSISLDPSQFALVGHGIGAPASGICGDDPCAPKSEKEWRSNMRVLFRIIQVEAESEVFQPL